MASQALPDTWHTFLYKTREQSNEIAFKHQDQEVSYGLLGNLGGKIGRWLHEAGLEKNEAVAIAHPMGPVRLASALGVSLAGGTPCFTEGDAQASNHDFAFHIIDQMCSKSDRSQQILALPSFPADALDILDAENLLPLELPTGQTLLENRNSTAFSDKKEQSTTRNGWTVTNAQLVDCMENPLGTPEDTSLLARFDRNVSLSPDAVAVSDRSVTLTYAALQNRAHEIALILRALDLPEESPFGLCCGRSHHTVTAMLAIMYAGGYYVPLDPEYPEDRLRFMLEDTGLSVILGTTHHVARLPEFDKRISFLDSLTLNGDAIDTNQLPGWGGLQVAYTMYTSGSTGRPKGVRIPQAGIVRLVCDQPQYHFGPHNIIGMISAVAFDASTVEIWSALLNGGRLVCYEPDKVDLQDVSDLIQRERLNFVFLTVALFRIFADLGLEALTSLRMLMTGGEAVPVKQVKKASKALPNCIFFNCYGPTENTTYTTIYPVTDAQSLKDHTPIGTALARTTCYVVDSALQLVPEGEQGELITGGQGLARDYLFRPALTAERFVPDPFSTKPGERLYLTGDHVHVMSDGNFKFIGRIDNQVKIRGFRIELGEIENSLATLPSVKGAVVVVVESNTGEKQIAAYVQPNNPKDLADPNYSEELNRQLKDILPHFMLPNYLVPLASFPANAIGKIDKKALPDPTTQADESAFEAPKTYTENTLATWYSQAFSLDQVSRNAQFLKLGGHSLLAARLVAFVREKLKVKLSVRVPLESESLAALAATIDSLESSEVELPVPRPSRGGKTTFPASFTQARLIFGETQITQSRVYNVITVLDYRGYFATDLLERSLLQLSDRHESLRSTFYLDKQGDPVQTVHEKGNLWLNVMDLRNIDDQKRLKILRKLSERDQMLAEKPLVYTVLCQLADDRYWLFMNIHHILTDARSQEVILRDWSAFYNQTVANKPLDLPEDPLQLIDASAWEQNQVSGKRLDKLVFFWNNYLEDFENLDLPFDRPRPVTLENQGTHYIFPLEDTEVRWLDELAANHQTTRVTVLLTLWSAVISRFAHQADILLGVPVANRNHPELEDVLGFFTNTTVFRMKFDRPSDSFRVLAQQAHHQWHDAYDHADMPFERLVEIINPERQPDRHPVFQNLFGYFHLANLEDFAGTSHELLHFDRGIAVFDTALEFSETATGLTGVLTYSTGLFDLSTIESLTGALRVLLKEAAFNPEGPLLRHNMMAPSIREDELQKLNCPIQAYPTVDNLWHPVYETSQSAPERISLLTKESAHSFGSLIKHAEHLSNELRHKGVRLESSIGCLIPRSPELITAMLAVWRSGGVYVPLDPDLPPERLSYMIDEAGIQHVLTTASFSELGRTLSENTIVVGKGQSSAKTNTTPVPALPHQLAYIIFTSGSTGRPKAVAVPHRAFWDHIQSVCAFLEIQEQDRILQFAATSFDVSLEQIMSTLVSGSALQLRDEDWTPDALTDLCDRHYLTVINLPTAFWAAWFHEERFPKTVRSVHVGGEALPASLSQKWPHDRIKLINAYGPTETVVTPSMYSVTGNEPDQGAVTIGRPFPNRVFRIMDRFGNLLPSPAIGELMLGGNPLARCYVSQPAKTAAVFLPDPLAKEPGARLYATGDLVRLLPDLNLGFGGRRDVQLKIRGFRIEPGEIEAVLKAQDGVRQAAAMGIDGPMNTKILAAYVGGNNLEESILLEALSKRLPEYMVPTRIEILDTLPETASGKVDRKALSKRKISTAGNKQFFNQPSQAEDKMIKVWKTLFPNQEIERTSHFFELGGHSLLAAKLRAMVRETFKVEMPVKAIFKAPRLFDYTDSVFVAMLAFLNNPGQQESLPSRQQTNNDARTPAPLSSSQERLWLFEKMNPGTATYHSAGILRITGDLDRHALDKALKALLNHQSGLRTVLKESSDGPIQTILESTNQSWQWFDGESLSEDDVVEQIEIDSQRPFQFDVTPPNRWYACRFNDRHALIGYCQHHIATDGWSMGLMLTQLWEAYAAFTKNQPLNWEPLSVHYCDLARAEQDAKKSGQLKKPQEFWRKSLDGVPGLLDLPHDRTRPAQRSYRGGRAPLKIPQEFTQIMERAKHDLDATPFVLLLAAYGVFLHRYSSQTDFAIAFPSANRGAAGADRIIGFFVNTLAMRISLAPNQGFDDLARGLKGQVLEAFENEHYPFESVLEDLKPTRIQGAPPLCQTLFVLQENLPLPQPAGLSLGWVEKGEPIALFDLTLEMEESPSGFAGHFTFAQDLFDSETIESAANHFVNLLVQLCKQPKRSIASHDMRSPEEHKALIQWWQDNRPERDARPIDRLIIEEAKHRLDVAALATTMHTLTYDQVIQSVNALAGHLRERGVCDEKRVAVLVRRSPTTVIAMLAIWRAGGVFVPIDPDYPSERQAYILDDAKASLLLMDDHADEPETTVEIIRLNATLLQQQNNSFKPRFENPDALAYLIYTSGSTGRPKGVAVPFRGLVNLATAQMETFAVGPGDRVLQFAALGFDAAISEMTVTLFAGATLILAERAERLPGPGLADTLLRQGIHSVTLPPSALAVLPTETYPALKTVIVAGEACGESLAKTWQAGRRFVNAYGPTEGTVCATMKIWDGQPGNPPIGPPQSHVIALVSDRKLHAVPSGVPGELCIGGLGLARGYHGNPGKTAAVFVPNPYGEEPGARLYKTGDRVRLDHRKDLHFLGRIDNQIKLRGYRIEPDEIASAITQHDGILECLVTIREDQNGQKRLAAYVLPANNTDQPDLAEALRKALRDTLPGYMIPDAFVILQDFPKTPNGKINVRALPEPSWQRKENPTFAPRAANPTEAALINIWQDVLGRNDISPEDSFFDLGGHSLLAAKVLSAIQSTFRIDLPMTVLFDKPILRDLAAAIIAFEVPNEKTATSIQLADRSQTLPLSSAQQRIWFFDQAAPGNPAYNVPHRFHVLGPFSPLALDKAWDEIVRVNEILRTSYAHKAGVPHQVLEDFRPHSLPVIDLRGIDARQTLTWQLAAEAARAAFDLSRAQPWRWQILILDEVRTVLLFTLHHIATDGWSMDLLFSALAPAYKKAIHGRKVKLSQPKLQYADYASSQNKWLNGSNAAEQEKFWLTLLQGDLPLSRTQFPRPVNADMRTAKAPFSLSNKLSRAILERCSASQMTPFMFFMTAYKILRAGCFKTNDILTGTPMANRSRPGLEDMMGIFVNTVALRFEYQENDSFQTLMNRLKKHMLAIQLNQDYPFDRLVDLLNPERQSQHPIVQAMFNFAPSMASTPQWHGTRANQVFGDFDMTIFDMVLSVYRFESDGNIHFTGELQYQKTLFDHETAQSMAECFQVLVQAMAETPERKAGAFTFPQLELQPEVHIAPRAKVLDPEIAAALVETDIREAKTLSSLPSKSSRPKKIQESEHPSAPVTLGKGFDNYPHYILDRHFNLMPIDFAGELCLGGESLARGYQGQASKTADRFVPDPFSDSPGARLYKTGDLASVDMDGNARFLGRVDHQIKIRGFRVELGEIESSISQYPEIQQAVAILFDAQNGGEKQIAAYYECHEGYALEPDILRARLQETIPGYMIPSVLMHLDIIPLTPNGKLDRKNLPKPDLSKEKKAGTAPRDAVEGKIAKIWCDILDLPKVNIEDNFFHLGGHSLIATRVTAAIREIFGVSLPIRDLFENPTIEGLAKLVRADRGETEPEWNTAQRADRSKPIPLSYAQERLWFLDRFEGASSTYNMPFAHRLVGFLDALALCRSITTLMDRHEVLRSIYSTVEGKAVQIPQPVTEQAMVMIDLSGLSVEERDQHRAWLIQTEGNMPFNLETGPVTRFTLLRMEMDDHAWLTNVHHIAFDGWSAGIFNRELDAIYSHSSRGLIPELPEAPIQYADYADWQRQNLTDRDLAQQIAYWTEKLAGDPPPLDLPTDRPRPVERSFHAANLHRELPMAENEGLRALCRDKGNSLFMGLLATFKVLLYRYSGQTDFCIGTPIAGRHRAGTESIVGCFLNTLVLRSDLDAEQSPSFQALLEQVRETTLDAYANQDVPFEQLLAKLKPERDLSRTPLFQVFFNMVNLAQGSPRLGNLELLPLKLADIGSKFDLTLYVGEAPDRLGFDLTYNTDLFDEATINHFLDQYLTLIEAVAVDPSLPLHAYSLLNQQSLELLADPAQPLDDAWHRPVHAWLSQQARQTPERIAVCMDTQQLTYSQVDRGSGMIAAKLLKAGLQKGDIVAIIGSRCLPLPMCIYGILKAGGTFLMIDPAYPTSRLIDFMEIAPAAAVIHLEEPNTLPSEFSAFFDQMNLVYRERLSDFQPVGEWNEQPVEITADDIAYIAFTSGSTGKPKAVLGRHGPLSHFLPWMNDAFDFGVNDRFSMLSGIAHDPLQRDIFTPLSSGAALVIPPEEAFSPSRLGVWMNQFAVTVAHLTPAMGQIVSASQTSIHHLRRAFFVGEALTRRDLVRLRKLAPQVICVNYYGTTETQRAVGWYPITETGLDHRGRPLEESGLGQVLPLGKGLPDVQLLVLNEAGQRAAIGERGEIYLRSPHLAAGYRGDAKQTSQRFLTNPFTDEESDRLYRTGDLGRIAADGNAVFLGRADFQIKIRGFRVEPGDIEAALVEHEAIHEALVLARQREESGLFLTGYLVKTKEQTHETEPASRNDLRDFLKQRVPEYMVPAAFVWLDAWPLTPNKKIDRRALPEPDLSTLADQSIIVMPRSDLESALVTIWSEILGLPNIGITDNFFDLGGHSLLATQLISRIEKELGYDLSLRTLFQKPTIEKLSDWLLETETAILEPGPKPIERGGPLPVSPAQKRLWFLQKLEPDNPAYAIFLPYRIDGELDKTALKKAYRHLLDRHETLRCTFPEINGEAAAVLDSLSSDAYHIRFEKASSERDAYDQMRDLSTRTFQLAEDAVIRAFVFEIAADDWMLAFHIHHIAVDGWSVGVMFADLSHAYRAAKQNEQPSLPDLPIQYPDFAAWHDRWLSGPAKQRDLAFWKEALDGAPRILELPSDFSRPTKPSGIGSMVQAKIPASLANHLQELAQKEQATGFMLFLAAFQTLIYRYTGMTDFLLGSPVANRNRAELENLVGCFVNTLLLRAPIAENGSNQPFTGLMQSVRDHALAAFEHSELTFDQLVESLQPQRDLSRNPLFQVSFIYQSGVSREVDFGGLQLGRVPMHGGTAQFDLTLTVLPNGADDWTILLEYATDLFEHATVERLAGHYHNVLQAIADNPTARIDMLPLMDEEERSGILNHALNQTQVDYPVEQSIHGLIAQKVAATPSRIACADENGHWTYEYLWRYAGTIADWLSTRGIGPESLVGVCLQRGNPMLGALLGVMRAGAAYVPLDPDFPRERLALIAEDAAMPVLLTDESTSQLWRDWQGQQLDVSVIRASNAESPTQRENAENLAYVIFTSGSTGRPKGVALQHRGVVNFLLGMAKQPGLNEHDRLLAVTTVSFDIAGLELYLPLVQGGLTRIATKESTLDPEKLSTILLSEQITIMQATPATWRMLFSAGWQGIQSLKALCGGEALPDDLGWRLDQTCGFVWNVYGPTETTIWSSRTPVHDQQSIHIGVPMENTTTFVVDKLGQPVPLGVPGELLIGGDGLARGYWQRPDLSADRFIPDALGGKSGSRLYRTGDLVRINAEGNLQYLNRLDFQVKVRGFRIELGDIEAALRSHPGIAEAAVIAVAREGDTQLAAFAVCAEGKNPTTGSVLEGLSESLPHYMIPTALTFLEAMPRNTSGKLDRKALAALGISWQERDAAYTAPRDGLEQSLCQLWDALLKRTRTGIHDSFFEFGGHSLLAVKLVSKLRQQFDTDLPITTLFQADTPAKLAEYLRAQSAGGSLSPLVCIKADGEGTPLFMPHTVLGGVMGYRHLAQHMNRPIYAFESTGLYPGGKQPESMEAMAAEYIDLMREIQPQGPHHIAGWSLGGILVLEIARQLTESGEPPASVSIIDTVPWLDPVEGVDFLRNFASVYAQHQQNFLSKEELEPLSEDERITYFLDKLRRFDPHHGISDDNLRRGYETYRANQSAAQAYKPTYRGHVTVYCCLERDPGPFIQRWLASGIPHTMHQIPGNHESLMEPGNVQVLASLLQQNRPLDS